MTPSGIKMGILVPPLIHATKVGGFSQKVPWVLSKWMQCKSVDNSKYNLKSYKLVHWLCKVSSRRVHTFIANTVASKTE